MPKTEVIYFRMESDRKRAWEARAKAVRRPLAEWIRTACDAYAEHEKRSLREMEGVPIQSTRVVGEMRPHRSKK